MIGTDTDIEALLHRQAQQSPERKEGRREWEEGRKKKRLTAKCLIYQRVYQSFS